MNVIVRKVYKGLKRYISFNINICRKIEKYILHSFLNLLHALMNSLTYQCMYRRRLPYLDWCY